MRGEKKKRMTIRPYGRRQDPEEREKGERGGGNTSPFLKLYGERKKERQSASLSDQYS